MHMDVPHIGTELFPVLSTPPMIVKEVNTEGKQSQYSKM